MKTKPILKALQESAERNKELYKFDNPDASLLETFENPASVEGSKGGLAITIGVPNFTCLCPLTSQPDYAELEVVYAPTKLCVESKSFKLYLLGYRNYGTFHEACVTQIGNDLVSLLDPHQLRVVGKFEARGGIPFWPTFIYQRPQSNVIAPTSGRPGLM